MLVETVSTKTNKILGWFFFPPIYIYTGEPQFTIPYCTEQSVFVDLTQSSENYELRYSLENNRTEGGTIPITFGKLYEVPHLQSNRKYRFTLQRKNSKDIIGKPTFKETAGELLILFLFFVFNFILKGKLSFKCILQF